MIFRTARISFSVLPSTTKIWTMNHYRYVHIRTSILYINEKQGTTIYGLMRRGQCLLSCSDVRIQRQRHKKFKEECFIYQTGTSPFDFTVQCFFDGFGVRQTLAPSNGLQWLSIIRPMIPLVKVQHIYIFTYIYIHIYIYIYSSWMFIKFGILLRTSGQVEDGGEIKFLST